jgi:hypothetical protein
MATTKKSVKKVTTKKSNSLTNKNQNSNQIGATTKLSNFTTNVLKEYNKTDAQKQLESVEDFRQNAIIETESVIGSLQTNTIPLLELSLKKAERTLETAEKNYEKSRFSTASSYREYLDNRAYYRREVRDAQNAIDSINRSIEGEQAQLNLYKEILSDLS